MSARHRPGADRTIVGVLALLRAIARLLPAPVAGALLRAAASLCTCLIWPWATLRHRARASGLTVSPWRLGQTWGSNLVALFVHGAPLQVCGWSGGEGAATLVLAAHQGAWEEAAAELARRGARPLVLAAPWPLLPRFERAVRRLRAERGVLSVSRSRDAVRQATLHLRSGGWVVVLVDSLSPRRAGRRESAFISDPVAPPDALVAWAARHGAAIRVATAEPGLVRLHPLREAGPPTRLAEVDARVLADRVIELLRRSVLAAPSEWAWVRALASVALMSLASSLRLGAAAAVLWASGCAAPVALPALPTHPEDWITQLRGLSWEGPVTVDGPPAQLAAASARVRWVQDGLVGAFEQVEVTLPSTESQPSLEAKARSAQGSWPAGPLTLRDVEFVVDGVSGRVDLVRWDAGGGLSCGGCALERLSPRAAP